MKKLSLILVVLLLIASMPLAALADSQDDMLIEKFKEKFGQELSKVTNKYTIGQATDAIDDLITIIKELDGKGILISQTYDEIEKNAELKQRCVELGITRDNVGAFAKILTEALVSVEQLQTPIKANFLYYLKGISSMPTEITDIMTKLRNDVNANLSGMVSTLNSKMANGYENKKGEFAVELSFAIYDNVSIKENSDNTWTVEYDSDFSSAINNVITSYTTYTSETDLSEAEITTLKSAVTEVVSEINKDKNKPYFNSLKDILTKAEKFTAYSAPDPGDTSGETGGGSGGTGGGSDDPEVTIPEDKEKPIEAGLPEDAVETSKNDEGQTEAKVDGDAVKDAVDSLVDAIKAAGDEAKSREAAVTVEVKADSEDLAVSIPADAVENLIENSIDLNIKSDKLEYNVPAGAIDKEALEEFGKDVTVQFNSKVVDTEEAFKDVELGSTLKSKGKVLELSLDVLDKKGEKVGNISKFKKPLTIKISLDDVTGDNDRLGIYFLNPETGKPEFVGGKVVDGKIILKIHHYSKYAIMEANITYTDLTGHWSKSYVESMAAKHVVNGYPDSTYLPEKDVTRAEFAKLIVKALELDMVKYDGKFSDITTDDWCADYVTTAASNGIVSGYPNETFMPDKEISRLEMATMLGNAMSNVELKDNTVNTLNQVFNDSSDIAKWGIENAAKVYQEGLMVGMDGKFSPQETTTRAQAATAIYRLFNK